MSWQAYIDTSLIGSQQLDKAAIVALAGNSVWAASPEFNLEPKEMAFIAELYSADKNTAEKAQEKAQTEGVHVAGERYIYSGLVDDTIYLRATKVEGDEEHEKMGVIMCKSIQAIVIAHHDHLHARQVATPIVANLAKYLVDQKY